jgi:hypothetical protein
MKKLLSTQCSLLALAALFFASTASAETIFLGFDTQGPVQQYSTAGAFLGNFGQSGATGSALGGGSAWTVAPNFGNNQIKQYDAAQNLLNSFTAAVGGNWIEDMAFGGGNTLWVGTYEGNIFNINATTGAVNSSFAVANSSFTGVAWDGTNLWATGGFSGNDNIYKLSTTGTLLATIHTGYTNGGGIGYSALTNSLWVGYYGDVRQFDLSGNLLSSFTAGSAFHDGLEIGTLQASTSVPEPATLLLLGAGLAGLGLRSRRA